MPNRFTLPAAATLVYLVGVVVPSATAGDSATSSIVGEGMHAFHGGCYEASVQLLRDAIDFGAQDPRAFYFRGLALKRLGDDDAAIMDFKEGARLEAVGDGVWPVGKALERIQGADRICLEAYRRSARLLFAHDAAVTTPREDESEQEMLRRRRPEMEDLPRPKSAEPMDAAPVSEAPAEPEEPEPRQPAPAGDDPFGADEPKPGPKENPVGAPSEPPAGGTPSKEPGTADPFADEPSGGGEAKPKAEAEEPAAEAAGVDDFK